MNELIWLLLETFLALIFFLIGRDYGIKRGREYERIYREEEDKWNEIAKKEGWDGYDMLHRERIIGQSVMERMNRKG